MDFIKILTSSIKYDVPKNDARIKRDKRCYGTKDSKRCENEIGDDPDMPFCEDHKKINFNEYPRANPGCEANIFKGAHVGKRCPRLAKQRYAKSKSKFASQKGFGSKDFDLCDGHRKQLNKMSVHTKLRWLLDNGHITRESLIFEVCTRMK